MAAARNPSVSLDISSVRALFIRAYASWNEDRAARLAAAFAFYAVLSLAPLLAVLVSLFGSFAGEANITTPVLREIRNNVGSNSAVFVSSLISTTAGSSSLVGGLASIVVALFGASNLFLQLDDSANIIWRVAPSGNAMRGFLVSRISSIIMVIVFGFTATVWVALDSWLGWLVRHAGIHHAWREMSIGVSFFFMIGACALAYKAMPRKMVAWRDVWLGATATAIGFVAMKFVLSLYFTYSGISAAYGSAGALVVILLWIYYMSQIFLFGLEITCVYAHTHGSQIGRRHLSVRAKDQH